MLNTFKYIKWIIAIQNNFSESPSGKGETLPSSLDNKKISDVEKFISENKAEIESWIKKNSQNDKFKDHIWVLDYSWGETSISWENLTSIAKTLKLPITENGFSVDIFMTELNKYAKDRKDLTGKLEKETSVETSNLMKDISEDTNKTKEEYLKKEWSKALDNNDWSSIISTFDIKKDKNNKQKVKELQKALWFKWKSVDWIFWRKTRNALNVIRKKNSVIQDNAGKQDVIDDQVDVLVSWEKEGLETPKSWDKVTDTPLSWSEKTVDETEDQIEKTGNVISEFEARLQLTKELNERLSKYYYRGNLWYSLENWVRTLFWDNKYKKILQDKEKYDLLMSDPEAKARLERAIVEVTRYWQKDYSNLDKSEIDAEEKLRWKNLWNKFLKIAPWIFGVYLWDIPVSIWQKMLPWANVNKVNDFNSWINSWMKWEFKDYKKSEVENLSPIKEQITLKDFLSRTNIPDEEKAKILSWKLDWLSEKTEKLLLTYLEVNLIPNLKILKNESFTIFSYFGKKHSWSRKLLKEMEAMVKSWSISGYEKKLSEFLNIIKAEWDVSVWIIDKVQWWNDYIDRISGNDKELQRQFNWLAKLWKEKFNTYNRLFALKNLNDIYNLWVSDLHKNAIWELNKILEANPIDWSKLDSWEKANTWALEFVKSIWDHTAMQRYQINNIPKSSNLRQVWRKEIERDTDFNDTHWVKLDWLDNSKDLEIAKTTSVDAKSWISTLGYAYKSFVEKAWLVWFSYQEFENAFSKKQKIDINSFDQETKIINTNRNSDWRIGKLTSFGELAKKRKDTHVFKMQMEKEYTYYEAWKEVKVSTKYDLYMRPDCSNPLIVPDTVKVTKEWKSIPEWELLSLTSRKWKIPIVLPWTIFNWSWGKIDSNAWSNPWADMISSGHWTWEIASNVSKNIASNTLWVPGS